jgi:hypothetical protein
MTREQRLLDAIAALSQQMAEAWERGTALADPAMVALSQQLDGLVVEWQRLAQRRPPDSSWDEGTCKDE